MKFLTKIQQSTTNNLKVINTLPPKKVGIAGSTLVRGKDIDTDEYKTNVIDKSDGAKVKTENSIHFIGQTNSPTDRIGIIKPSSVDISTELKGFDQLDHFNKDSYRQKEVHLNFSSKPQLDGRGDEYESFFSMQPLYSLSEERQSKLLEGGYSQKYNIIRKSNYNNPSFKGFRDSTFNTSNDHSNLYSPINLPTIDDHNKN